MDSVEGPVDRVYFDSLNASGLARRMAGAARRRIFADFMELMAPRPGELILDVGVSDVISDEANFLEREYPYRTDITCAGLGDGTAVLAAYPGVAYQKIVAGASLPFADGAFAIATCNAVLEHAGDDTRKRFLIHEMLRVANRVFIAVPHRWFPVEHHTAIPLLHYWPALFRAVCTATGRGIWADPNELDFLSAPRLRRLMPAETNPSVRWSGLPLGPFSSNLICAARKAG